MYVDEIGDYFDPYGQNPQHAEFTDFMNEHCSQWSPNDHILDECNFDIMSVCVKRLLTAMWRIIKLILTGIALLRKIEAYTVEECYCTLNMVSIIRKSLN